MKMKKLENSVLGIYNGQINNKDCFIIPIWEVFVVKTFYEHYKNEMNAEKSYFCLVIFNTNIKSISVINTIGKIFRTGSVDFCDLTETYRVIVISKDYRNELFKSKVKNFTITDKDFAESLNFEEVREMFGDKKNHPALWSLISWNDR